MTTGNVLYLSGMNSFSSLSMILGRAYQLLLMKQNVDMYCNYYLSKNPDKCASLPDEILNKQLLPGICQVSFVLSLTLAL